MKTLATLLFIIVSSCIAKAQSVTDTHTVKAVVNNVRSNKGKVIFSLHTQDTFLKGKGVQNVEATIENGIATATFTNIEPGTYAILVLHDENENHRMDYEPTGMPKEDYGMTNNVMVMGPPQFQDAQFEVTNKDLEFTIRF